MSRIPWPEPGDPDAVGRDAIETLLLPRAVDVNPFLRRVLPAPQRQMVGPFIFFDQFGPLERIATPKEGVRPHPHIGLATVTYLYRGEVHHRDSLGTNQIITPGAVNWMVAGRGITHSERAPAALVGHKAELYGIQTWVALPQKEEEAAPRFEHHAKDALPVLEDAGVEFRLILGSAFGAVAPASIVSDTFYADVALRPGARMPLPDEYEERGLHILDGSISVAGETFEAGQMMVFRPKDPICVAAGERGARFVMLGGAPLDGPRYLWWNFVSSSKEKIVAAREEWRKGEWGRGQFDLPADDRDEFIPLPENAPPFV